MKIDITFEVKNLTEKEYNIATLFFGKNTNCVAERGEKVDVISNKKFTATLDDSDYVLNLLSNKVNMSIDLHDLFPILVSDNEICQAFFKELIDR